MLKIGVGVLLCALVTGCVTNQPTNLNNLTDAQFATLVQTESLQAQQLAIVATDVSLSSISDPVERTKVMTLANLVATAINTTAQGSSLDLSSIQPLVDGLLTNATPQNKQLVNALINSVLLGVENVINSNNVVFAQTRQVVLVKSLLASAAQGVINETKGLSVRKANLAKDIVGV